MQRVKREVGLGGQTRGAQLPVLIRQICPTLLLCRCTWFVVEEFYETPASVIRAGTSSLFHCTCAVVVVSVLNVCMHFISLFGVSHLLQAISSVFRRRWAMPMTVAVLCLAAHTFGFFDDPNAPPSEGLSLPLLLSLSLSCSLLLSLSFPPSLALSLSLPLLPHPRPFAHSLVQTQELILLM